jgi:hypothetical protein
MRAADGNACPMHQPAAPDPHAAHRAASTPSPSDDCVMRGTCEGPAVALSVLFSVPAVMPADAVIFIPPATQFVAADTRAFAPVPLTSDTPPPRA